MPGCSAVGCANRSEKGFKMYRFPTKPERRKFWEAKVNRVDWKSSRTSFLCQEHFTYDQFENNRADGMRRLRWNAIPTIFPNCSKSRKGKLGTSKNIILGGSGEENKENDSLGDHSFYDPPQPDEPSVSDNESTSERVDFVQETKKFKGCIEENETMEECAQEVKLMKECVQEVIKIQEEIAQLEKELQDARNRKRGMVTTKGGISLTKDERVEIILLSGHAGWTYQRVAKHFNELHPERKNITHSTVSKLVKKFKTTGCVLDQSHFG